MHRLLITTFAAVAIGAAAFAAGAPETGSASDPTALARVQGIRAELDARYRPDRNLTVTEASSTGVVESFTLLTADLMEARIVPADYGIYFAICPVRATCPYPARRLARPAAAFLPRRLALELAVRTFLETTATLVAISLPTPRFVIFIAEREQLAREVDLPAMAESLSGDLARPPSPLLQRIVDKVTRPRTYLPLGLEPTPTGRDTFAVVPLWPGIGAGGRNSAFEPSGASGYDVPDRLNEVAHVYSLGAGEIRCPTQTEWDAYYGSSFAWGATNLREDYTTLAPFICEGALGVGGSAAPLWLQAASVWVLVHEAFHLRHWRFRSNEAKVACQAIVYFRDAAMRLGASEEEAEELYPYALALHIRQAELFSWYRDPKCHAPLWAPPAR